jgi:DNA-binding transcriptional ArsR family regulator
LWVGGHHAPALDALRTAASASKAAGELNRLPELLAYQGLAHLGLNQPARALAVTRQAILALAQGAVSQEVVPEIFYAHAMALQANGLADPCRAYLIQAYESLLAGAAEIEDEAGRQAIFHRNPTTRRLMRALEDCGLASPTGARTLTRRLPAAHGGSAVPVPWTVDAGPADLALRNAQGAIALRRARLARLLLEAEAHGARPTVAQLAEALGMSQRTIQRDIAVLRDAQYRHPS